MLHNLDADSSKIIEVLNQDPNGVRLTQAQVLYVEYLVSNMKAIGTWQLSNAVYGFVGGTDYKHKFNWKDPRDLDAAFRLTYSGGITHSANGMQGNGTTGFADTKINPSTQITYNSTHLSHYCNVASVNGNMTDIGVYGTTIDDRLLLTHNFGGSYFSDLYTYLTGRVSAAADSRKGLLLATRTSSTSHKLFKNGDLIGSSTQISGGALPNRNIFIMATNGISGTAVDFSNRPVQYSSIGSGLTDTQAVQQSQIVTNAQNILSRA